MASPSTATRGAAVMEAAGAARDVVMLSPPGPIPLRDRGCCYRCGVLAGQVVTALVSPLSNALALRACPAELWVCICLQLIISINFYALSLVLTEYLSLSFHMSDQRAGLAYGVFGTMTSILAFPCGLLSDYAGIRWSIFVSGALNMAGRILLSLTRSPAMAQTMLFSVLPLASAIDFGICATAVRRFTPKHARAMGFALLATVMYVGQLLAGVLRDAFVLTSPDGHAQGGGMLAINTGAEDFVLRVTGQRALLLFGAALAAAELGLSGFAAGKGAVVETPSPFPLTLPTPSTQLAPRLSLRQKLRMPPRAMVAQTLSDPQFWRYSLLLVTCSFVRMLLTYVQAAMPKYLSRQLGGHVPIGSLLSIPPALCIFLVPLITTLSDGRVSALTMITAGAFVTAASLVWLVSSISVWSTVLFLVTFALGDAMWSPRLMEYAAQVSPATASSTWSALGTMPLFAAKLPAGLLSGILLAKFVPEQGHRRPRVMWAIVWGITSVGPIALLLLRRVITGGAAAPMTSPRDVWRGTSSEPVELADSFLQGGFDEGDMADGAPDGCNTELVALMQNGLGRQGAVAREDPENPFA
jgi:POT family proton-dependent oligopeptide transporter